jgi:phosphoglycolate phosphatase
MSADVEAPLRRPRAILFDWDNTLVDNWPVIHDALNATLTAMGHPPWSLEETKTRVRASLRDSFPQMFGNRWREAEQIYYDAFSASHLRRLREMPGAGAMLAALADRGLYLAVVSNKHGRFLRLEADRLSWTGYFGRLVGARDAPRDKPAVEPVDLALSGSGIPRGADVWFVGDTEIDIECAANAACVPILMRAAPPGDHEFVRSRPACHVPGCAALTALIDGL